VEAEEAVERAGKRNRNGLKAKKLPASGQTDVSKGADGRPGGEARRQDAKWQAGTVDPGMEAAERR
jgi:hypothetical protein